MSGLPHMPQGYDLVAVDTVDSTNDELKRRAVGENAVAGTVLWSLEQTKGKGRQKRDWVSKPGNMYCSVLLRPECAMAEAAQIGFLPVIAAGEALVEMLGASAPVRYKWPNDLLLNRRKIGGALLEAGIGQNSTAAWVIVGLGVNLRHHPGETRFPATNVNAEMGREIEIADLVGAYIKKIAAWYERWQAEGFEPVRAAWLASAHTFDEPLIVESGSATISGPFRDLDENGSLIIETDEGPRRITAGDVYFTGSENGGA